MLYNHIEIFTLFVYLHVVRLIICLHLPNFMSYFFAEKCAAKANDEQVEDKPCTRCGKSNQPEWVCGHNLYYSLCK